MKRLQHRIAHFFGWTTGSVETFWAKDRDYLMVGFRCDGCSRLDGVHRVPESIFPKELR